MAVNGNTIGKLEDAEHTVHAHGKKPFKTVQDFLSNVSNFQIIESTLREGEQFANAFFDTETKVKIARALDDFGVEYIELTSPASSEQSRRDCETIAKLGLKAKIYVKSTGKEIRFSSEDSFRSDLVDLLSIYQAVDKVGVTRALEAGATHVDTVVLPALDSALRANHVLSPSSESARMLTQDRDYVKSKYALAKLKAVEDLVASAVEVSLGDQLGLDMTDAQIKQCTAKVKAMADVRRLAMEDTDIIINQFYRNLNSKQEQPLLDDLTVEEQQAFAKKEKELNGEPEMQKLKALANAHTNGVVTDHVEAPDANGHGNGS
ncbi:MAG: hypothetical protein Q9224_000793 [Gallowayella concinna]